MWYGYTLVDELIPPHNIHINNQQDLSVATKHEYYTVSISVYWRLSLFMSWQGLRQSSPDIRRHSSENQPQVRAGG